MSKKRIIVKETQLKEMIVEATQAVLNQSKGMSESVIGLITEMARINKKESSQGIFPSNAFEVKIWSNDHTPPHFIILKDGWNISFEIENGNLLKVEGKGPNAQDYNYIVKNVSKWLNSQSAIIPTISNQQNAMAVWEQLHDE